MGRVRVEAGPSSTPLCGSSLNDLRSRPKQPSGTCAICKKTTTRSCTNCGGDGVRAFYCSREHQKQDWKTHKRLCQPWKVWIVADDWSKTCGLNQIAQYEARGPNGLPNPGTHVTTRRPLLVYPAAVDVSIFRMWGAPRWMAQIPNPENILKGIRACVGCCVFLPYDRRSLQDGDNHNEDNDNDETGSQIGACPKCKWPLHNESCAKLWGHDQLECSILASRSVLPTDSAHDNTKLGLLRAVLLKKTQPADYEQLLAMPYSVHFQLEPEMVKEMEDFVLRDCGLHDEVDKDVLHAILKILLANSQRIKYSCDELSNKFANVIFKGEQGRILPHSCIPNCELAIDPFTFIGVVRTIKKVEAGAQLTCNYTLPNEKPAKERIQELRDLMLDHKSCDRCDTPDEGGTHLSSITCSQCAEESSDSQGLLLPQLIPQTDTWIWRCNKNSTHSKPAEEVERLVRRFLAEVEHEYLQSETSASQKIEEFVPSVLHENHYAVLIARKMITRTAMDEIRNLGRYLKPDAESTYEGRVGTADLKPGSFNFHNYPGLMQEWKNILDFYNRLEVGLTFDYVDNLFHYILLCMSKLSMAVAKADRNCDADHTLEQLESWTPKLMQCVDLLKGHRSMIVYKYEFGERICTLHYFTVYLGMCLGLKHRTDLETTLRTFILSFTITPGTPKQVRTVVSRLMVARDAKAKRVHYFGCDNCNNPNSDQFRTGICLPDFNEMHHRIQKFISQYTIDLRQYVPPELGGYMRKTD